MSARSSTRIERATALAIVVGIAAASACSRKDSSGAPSTQDTSETATVKVAAAADLALAFRDLAVDFEKKTGTKVVFTFGSTGNLAKQIAEGAKYDLFAAANQSYIDDVVKAGACDGATKTPYARGRIVIWTKKDAPTAPPTSLADLTDKRFVKIAIANPEHAPYGLAAKQALTKAGVWETVKPKLVYGENIQQTMQFGQTGNVEAAIVALSLALSDTGKWVLIDDAQHEPIDQSLVICKGGTSMKGAKDFAAFVGSPEGRTVMRRYGFVLPGESVDVR